MRGETLNPHVKFGRGGEEQESYRYGGVYARQHRSGGTRLFIGPVSNHCELVAELLECLPEPVRLLYVLVVARSDEHGQARYESPDLSHEDVITFITEHRRFLESDGRHHLWVANPDAGLIVYDRHEVLYAYGPVDCYTDVLNRSGLREGVVAIPSPHWHAYHAEFDDEESAVLARWPWQKTPLLEADEE